MRPKYFFFSPPTFPSTDTGQEEKSVLKTGNQNKTLKIRKIRKIMRPQFISGPYIQSLF